MSVTVSLCAFEMPVLALGGPPAAGVGLPEDVLDFGVVERGRERELPLGTRVSVFLRVLPRRVDGGLVE